MEQIRNENKTMKRPKLLNEYTLYEIDNLPPHRIKTVVVGELNYTIFLYTDAPHLSGKMEIAHFSKKWGGGGLYLVDSLAHLGGNPILFTYTGSDNESSRMLDYLVNTGVDIKNVKKIPDGNTPFRLLFIERRYSRILLDVNYTGVKKLFSVRNFKYEDIINGISSIYVEGSLINDQTIDEIIYMLKYFTNRGVSTSVTQAIGRAGINEGNLRKIINNLNVIFVTGYKDAEDDKILKTAEELKKQSKSLTTVVFVNPHKTFIHHFNSLFSINHPFKDLHKDSSSHLAESSMDFQHLFTGAFIFFYQKRLPIELTGLFSMLYAKASKRREEKTGVDAIKKMLHRYKIIDSGNNSIMIQ